VGLEIPETRINKEDPPIYALPPRYLALGIHQPSEYMERCALHLSQRDGEFNHDSFSRLYLDEDKANFQLHTWEYLIAEELMVMWSARSLEVGTLPRLGGVRLQTRSGRLCRDCQCFR